MQSEILSALSNQTDFATNNLAVNINTGFNKDLFADIFNSIKIAQDSAKSTETKSDGVKNIGAKDQEVTKIEASNKDPDVEKEEQTADLDRNEDQIDPMVSPLINDTQTINNQAITTINHTEDLGLPSSNVKFNNQTTVATTNQNLQALDNITAEIAPDSSFDDFTLKAQNLDPNLNTNNTTSQALSLDDLAQNLNVKTVSIKHLDNIRQDQNQQSDVALELFADLKTNENSYVDKLKENYLQSLATSNEQNSLENANKLNTSNLPSNVAVALTNLKGALNNSSLSVDESLNYKLGAGQAIKSVDSLNVKGQSFDINTFVNAQNYTKQLDKDNLLKNQAQTMSLSHNFKQNAEEITNKVMEMAAKNLKTMEIELDPQNLGKMKILFNLDGDNEAVSVAIATSNPATKDLIEQSSGRIKDVLAQNNIAFDSNIYDLNDFNGGSYQGSSQGQAQDQQQQGFKQGVLFADSKIPLESANDEVVPDNLHAASIETKSGTAINDGSLSFFA